jgi:hypothetical protein
LYVIVADVVDVHAGATQVNVNTSFVEAAPPVSEYVAVPFAPVVRGEITVVEATAGAGVTARETDTPWPANGLPN